MGNYKKFGFQFYSQKLQKEHLNSNCHNVVISYNRNSDYAYTQCDVVYNADTPVKYLSDKHKEILNDYMSANSISYILVWEDSVTFQFNDIAYDGNFVKLVVTKKAVRNNFQMDSNAYYYW